MAVYNKVTMKSMHIIIYFIYLIHIHVSAIFNQNSFPFPLHWYLFSDDVFFGTRAVQPVIHMTLEEISTPFKVGMKRKLRLYFQVKWSLDKIKFWPIKFFLFKKPFSLCCPMCQVHVRDRLSVCRDIRPGLTMDGYALLLPWVHTKTTVDSTYLKDLWADTDSLINLLHRFP